MITTESGASGVIVYVICEPGNILFLQRGGGRYSGSWWPVAGTPLTGESSIETARRELQEETGLVPASFYHFGLQIPHSDGVSRLDAFVTYVAEQSTVTLNHEHQAWRWQTPAQTLASVPASAVFIIRHLISGFIEQRPAESMLVDCD